ncbi:IclR family transcriptional regulator [Sulfitobacter sp. HNIBRBA3233]|uniref:IclR family transcriptional regulator n=1 Tax=Sulfitobacter marinivivus TaxID=3158558 RepID=UPI0032DEFBF7
MDHFDPELEGKDRNFVTALARGLEILRCFRGTEVTLTNSDFAERTGMPKATISRLTHTLCALDYLVADSRVGTYRLSTGVLQLGFAALTAMDLGERVAPEMRSLRDDGPNPFITVALGEQHRDEVVYIATETSGEDVSLVIRVGSRLPLFHSAMGKAVLVGMNDAQRGRALDFVAEHTPEKAKDAELQMNEAIAEFAEKGFCTGYGNWRPDVNGIAVPVHQLQGDRVFGLNVGGPAYRVKPKQLESVYAERLITAARRLSLRP